LVFGYGFRQQTADVAVCGHALRHGQTTQRGVLHFQTAFQHPTALQQIGSDLSYGGIRFDVNDSSFGVQGKNAAQILQGNLASIGLQVVS